MYHLSSFRTLMLFHSSIYIYLHIYSFVCILFLNLFLGRCWGFMNSWEWATYPSPCPLFLSFGSIGNWMWYIRSHWIQWHTVLCKYQVGCVIAVPFFRFFLSLCNNHKTIELLDIPLNCAQKQYILLSKELSHGMISVHTIRTHVQVFLQSTSRTNSSLGSSKNLPNCQSFYYRNHGPVYHHIDYYL